MARIPLLTLNLSKSALLMLALVVAATTVLAGDDRSSAHNNVLDVAYVEFPPYEYTDAQGKAAGIFIDVTRKTLERAGFTPRFQPLPIARIYLYLQQGLIDLWPGLAAIPALQGHVLESQVAPFRTQLKALFLEGTAAIDDIEDMQGQRVILISGYTYGGLLYQFRDSRNSFRVVTARTHQSALHMLELGRGDYLLDYEAPISSLLNERSIPNLRQVSLISQQGAFILSRKTPDARAVMGRIEDAYQQLRAENLIEDIVE